MNRAGVVAAGAVGLAFALSSPLMAADAGSGVELTWLAPEGCATGDDVRAKIARLLEASSKPAEKLTIRAQVDHSANVWHVTLETEQKQSLGQREIRAESCEALADAVALVVAMSIDPEAVLQNQSESANAGSSAPTPSVSVRPTETPPPPKRAQPRRRALGHISPDRQEPENSRAEPWALGVAAAADAGRLPHLALGESAFLAVQTRDLRLELGGTLYWPVTTEVPDHPDAGGRFRLFTARVRGCYRLSGPALVVGACGGGDLSWISAQGVGVRTPANGSAWLLSPALGGELIWPASGQIALVFWADLMLSLGRRPFEIDQVVVHEPSPVTGAAALGGEVHF